MVLVCGRCLFCRWSGRLVDGLRVRWVSYHTEPGLQWRRYSDKPQFLLRCVAMVRLPFRTGSDSAVRKRVFQAESLKRFGERRALDLILMWTCPRKWRLWECRRVRWWVGSASLIGSFWWWCESCFIVDHAFNLAWVAILSLCIRFCSLDWLTIHLISDALQMCFFFQSWSVFPSTASLRGRVFANCLCVFDLRSKLSLEFGQIVFGKSLDVFKGK